MLVAQAEPAVQSSIRVLRTKTHCMHGRIIDDLVTAEGKKTGEVICIECLAIFPDPILKHAPH